MTGLNWDIDKDGERTRYIWPKAAIETWWRNAVAQNWGHVEEPSTLKAARGFGMESAEDRVLAGILTRHGLSWWQAFGPGDNGKSLFFDPFHLPLYDPETGELSPKHPDSDVPTAWNEDILQAFREALLARMRAGKSCRGVVLPGAFDIALDSKDSIDDDRANPSLTADFSGALFAGPFVVSRRRFAGPTHFDGATFAADAAFDGAQFKGDTSFIGTGFAGPADFEEVRFWDAALFTKAVFKDPVLFEGAQFSGSANFEQAHFGGAAHFQRAQFLGVQFSEAVFQGAVDFESTQLLGAADFSNVDFAGPARFEGCQFSGTAGFENAGFDDTVSFEGAQFSGTADFGTVMFAGTAQFSGVQFPEWIRFDGAHFLDAARFDGVVFTGRAAFAGASFEDAARFDMAQFWSSAAFDDARFEGLTLFKGARFSATAAFKDSEFSGFAGFGGAQFSEAADFKGAQFSDCALFDSAQFAGPAQFEAARFSGKILFENAQFWQPADFSLGLPPHRRRPANGKGERGESDLLQGQGAAEPDVMEIEAWHNEGAFHSVSFAGAFFLDHVRFDNRLFLGRSNFKDTAFCKPPEFHGATLHRQTSFLRARFFAAPGASRQDLVGAALGAAGGLLKGRLEGYEWDALRGFLRELKSAGDFEIREKDLRTHGDFAALHTLKRVQALHAYLKSRSTERTDTGEAFEHAFQTLKNAMRDRRGRADEQRYFALELRSRRTRQDGEVTLLEWIFSWAYDLVSGHGQYIWRPLALMIIAVPLLMAGLYGALTEGAVFTAMPDFVWFVLEPSLNPFAANRLESVVPGFADLSDWQRVGLNIALGVHRVLVLVLLFLAGLAIRRRFQIT